MVRSCEQCRDSLPQRLVLDKFKRDSVSAHSSQNAPDTHISGLSALIQCLCCDENVNGSSSSRFDRISGRFDVLMSWSGVSTAASGLSLPHTRVGWMPATRNCAALVALLLYDVYTSRRSLALAVHFIRARCYIMAAPFPAPFVANKAGPSIALPISFALSPRLLSPSTHRAGLPVVSELDKNKGNIARQIFHFTRPTSVRYI